MDESVGSSASYVILSDSEAAVAAVPVIVPEVAPKAEAAVVASPAAVLDLVLESNMETEPSEAPPSPDGTVFYKFHMLILLPPIDLNEKVNVGVVTEPICDNVTRRGINDDSGLMIMVTGLAIQFSHGSYVAPPVYLITCL
ncbi:hypothetical protein Tco_0072307 [Tanacetum coccineum]